MEAACEPLYLKLKTQLLNNISTGAYKKGEKIPTELELAESFGVSRITVRKALKELEVEGLLIRYRGRGTFVAEHTLRRNLSMNTSFTTICLMTGQVPGAKTIKSVIEDATEADRKELNLPSGSKVIVLERIRYVDKSPVAIEISRFPETFSFLIDEDLTNASMISTLAEKYDIHFTTTSTKTLRQVYATYEQAKYLGLPKGYPLISISCVSNNAEGVPCHRSLQLVVGDRFELYL